MTFTHLVRCLILPYVTYHDWYIDQKFTIQLEDGKTSKHDIFDILMIKEYSPEFYVF